MDLDTSGNSGAAMDLDISGNSGGGMDLDTSRTSPSPRGREQRGAALLVALFMLIAILLLGASAAQLALQGEKTARAGRDREIALEAAEEALMDAENDIEGGSAAPGRSAMFAPDSALGFADDCGAGGAGADLGLCLRSGPGEAPVWQRIDLADDAATTTRSVPYGRFTGAAMASGNGLLPFRRPRYIIELLLDTQPGQDASGVPHYLYRVTAIGFGTREGTQVVLQSIYRKQAATGGAP